MAAERRREGGATLVPASTAWPMVLAVGVTLLVSGLVTSVAVSGVGAVLFVAAAVGWFREVLPHERHEPVALEEPPAPIRPSPRSVRRLAAGGARHRARLPVEVYPVSAGIRGGVAGGVAMAALALLHGVVNHGSLWYTINLLAAAASAELSQAGPEALAAFSLPGLVLALVIHATLSLLVGLLYGAILPMFPWHPAWWGGVVAPLLWTGLIAASLGIIDPALNARIEWPWFVASQIAFGLVAGLVVARSGRIATFQHASLAERAGLETSGRVMTARTLVASAALALVVGCDSLPGRPRPESRPVRPSQVTDFATLYAENCSGCHGSDTAPGAAVALADPVYLAFADDATLRLVTSQGVPGTVMPGFARSQGGTLTDAQIEILVSGMRARWARPGAIDGAAPPPYAAAPGDAGRGAQVYTERCEACHGARGTGGERGGSVVDGSYLGLVSDQGLRTAVVVGRPALGMPDWRGDVPGHPMSTQDVADVVAWLIAQRPEFPGQPYPTPIATRGPHDG